MNLFPGVKVSSTRRISFELHSFLDNSSNDKIDGLFSVQINREEKEQHRKVSQGGCAD